MKLCDENQKQIEKASMVLSLFGFILSLCEYSSQYLLHNHASVKKY